MQFSEFVKLPDMDKVVLVEVKVGKEVQDESWTATGSGSYWCSFVDGEAVSVSELLISNGTVTAYSKVASIALCDSTTSSFFFDYDNQRLYVHPSGDDSPDTASKYNIISYFWVCITNQQDEQNPTIYTPQDASNEVYYLPYLDPKHTHSFVQQVKDFYTGIVPWYKCTLRFLNDGWFYEAFKNWIWHNKDTEVKVGQKGSSYVDFECIVKGKAGNLLSSDESATINVKDSRTGELRQLPIYKFWKSDYPNLEDETEGKPIPILFGEKEGIIPVCIDTSSWVYKMNYYIQESIDAVYKDGEELEITIDYTVNANNNEITLLADPGESKITCDAKGLKCDKDTSVYSENIGDILWYVLKELNSIPTARLDESAFDSLISSRSQRISWYMDESISTFNFIRILQQTGLFQLIPLPNGKYIVKFYESGVPSGTPELKNEDYVFLGIFYQTSAIHRKAIVKYDRNLSTDEWKSVEYEDEKIPFKYDEEKSLVVESALRLKEEAESLADMYSQMATIYEKRIKGRISAEGMGVLPTEKIQFTKSIVDGEGNEVSLFTDEVYRILELKKDFLSMKTDVFGVKDEIGSSHANKTHDNTAYVDTHKDRIHENEHDNVAHKNATHDNQVYHNNEHDNYHGNHDDIIEV